MTTDNNTLDIEVRSLLEARRVRDAIARLENVALQFSDSRSLDEIRQTAESYDLLSRYALDGAEDPSRDSLLDDIMARLSAVATGLKREMLIAQAPTLYYNNLRTERHRGSAAPSLAQLAADYRKATSDLSLALMAGNPAQAQRQAAEALERELFSKLWTLYPLRKSDAELVLSLIADESLPLHFKEMTVGALLIGLDTVPDDRRLELLADIYDSASETVALKALTTLILSLWINSGTIISRRVANRIAALRDTRPQLGADIRETVMQIIRTRDTDRISRKITEEVIPEMMKLRPDIEKSMKGRPAEDFIDPEANPEWEEILEKSGVADRLRELQEMQEEGADVMMSTFGRLKTFPFFNDIANWFVPFRADRTAVTAEGVPSVLATMTEQNPMFCDNDKYSFTLSIAHIPAAQREMVESQLEAAADQFHMMEQGSAMTDADRRRNIIRNYMRDLYRFFKLFRRKGEFADPFARPVNPSRIPLFGPMLESDELLTLIGQFYFKNRYYEDACEILNRRATLYGFSPELLQKIGYSLQQLGRHAEALDSYQRSEMLGDSSKWLMQRMVACYRALGRHEEALETLRRLEAIDPDDLRLARDIGRTLMKLGRHAEALRYLYKVDYSQPGKVSRLIAWATFMTGDYEKSASLYEHILADNPSASDLLNAGHLAFVKGDYRRAAQLYSRSVAAREFNFEMFMLDFAPDRSILAAKGVTPLMEGLVLDEASRLAASMGSQI